VDKVIKIIESRAQHILFTSVDAVVVLMLRTVGVEFSSVDDEKVDVVGIMLIVVVGIVVATAADGDSSVV
jgi:hypothetical protein